MTMKNFTKFNRNMNNNNSNRILNNGPKKETENSEELYGKITRHTNEIMRDKKSPFNQPAVTLREKYGNRLFRHQSQHVPGKYCTGVFLATLDNRFF